MSGEMDYDEELATTGDYSTFEVDLNGFGSQVWIDGVEVKGLRTVSIQQPLNGPPVVILEIVAERVKSIVGK